MVHLDYLCGYKFYHPKWIQRFATTKTYIAIYGLLGTIQAMSHMYIIVTLTTMEKRFKMPSETTGIILSGNEISQILFSIILSYYGGKRNRPRWISWGITFCAMSCFIIALPHFIYGAGDDILRLTKEYEVENENINYNKNFIIKPNNEQEYLLRNTSDSVSNMINTFNKNSSELNSNRNQALCNSKRISSFLLSASSSTFPPNGIQPSFSNNLSSLVIIPKISNEFECNKNEIVMYVVPLVLVFFSQFVLGIGNSLYYALGQTYLDDNTNKTKTPLMLAFAMTLRMIGPIIGFFLGYGSLNLFIDFRKTPLINAKDPRWLGAWWFGWIILGSVMLIFAFLMGLFPKTMPQHENSQIDLENIENDLNRKFKLKNNMQMTKDFWRTLLRILRNRLLMCNIFSGTFYLLGALGYMTFLAKIMEVQFFKSRRDATIIIGPMIVAGMIIGFIVSGVTISKRKPNASKLLTWNIIVGIIHLCFIVSHFFIYCEDTVIKNIGKNLNFITPCNMKCQCNARNVTYYPICDKLTDITYFSPCHAGCQTWNSTMKAYTNCQCLINDVKEIKAENRFLKSGHCLKNCGLIFISFAILSMASNCLVSTGKIGNILVSFRAIPSQDKSIAQGLILTLVSLLASIPGPIIYGRIIDMTCLKWNIKCGKYGNCQYYDQTKFRYYLNITGFGLTLIGVFFDYFVWHYGKNLELYNENGSMRNERVASRKDGNKAIAK
ncbi:solute carrier organic anion transporter family member 74D [Condylostylus longicornis]|uniref:solute carrier organic anion transporter family member 74D n=1 Tax=Condylostylus longicornis TaxID=2530218 RepID=UPI00244E3128|nr:solute carrier organic anion transporter family member 74D [Condylostylus longicornis]